ncbi:MAG: hypothetical protein JOZ70_12330, partial [Pseudolabrys sp.]|nr:hypothetical protein [Pseudolabrys sp.]
MADILNPGINRGTAGMGSGTNLTPPPDNSFDRRADFSNAHKARKSTASNPAANKNSGFAEAPQKNFELPPVSGIDPRL